MSSQLLGSSHSRRSKLEGGATRRKEFRSPQGLKVHALDPDRFYKLDYQLEGDAVGFASAAVSGMTQDCTFTSGS